jgi:hypothetical protein
MKKYKNIYINGCSFTAGYELEEKDTWPELLSKKLNLQKINKAINGQSFDSIFTNTIAHLSNLDPNDTLVVIGTTWPTRYSIPFQNLNINITPVDIWTTGSTKENFADKLHPTRLVSPYDMNLDLEIRKQYFDDNIEGTKLKEGLDKVCMSFVNFYENLIKYDDDWEKNQKLYHQSKFLALQSFLEVNKFNYRIVDFIVPRVKSEVFDMDKIYNDDNFIYFDKEWRGKYVDSTLHPTPEGCISVSAVLYDSLINQGVITVLGDT